ncbi:zf-HC2 domain-containing protein [Amycolatopsis sp. A133]|uniref:zf-HC2 domain-containing protein n=1 Tax=Amycolatopsis sp. A133 TaxID=3064472 RepID=UPI0027F55E93|nr:zf-HC2 domain-containing protein [Amycolatopsis sp. A133]MDQ7803028.1 zf-HC2 domain-containing protein [Amycolatopsis sp. A133]
MAVTSSSPVLSAPHPFPHTAGGPVRFTRGIHSGGSRPGGPIRWNRDGLVADYLVVDCALFRESLSAAMDGEPGPLPGAEVDRHLGGCAACRAWQEEATRLRRSMLRRAPVVPDLTAAILAAAPPPAREKWTARIALATVGLVQSGLGFAEFLLPGGGHTGHSGGVPAIHLGNESAAWNLALGIGLLWAALHPRAAGAQLPLFGGFALVLTAVSVVDASGGEVGPGRLLSHGLLLVGLVLLVVVHREHRRRPAPAPLTAGALDTGDDATLPGPDAPEAPAPARPRFPRRPAGRHRAA